VPGKNATFDYVVIGSDLAGSVVASRLAEDPSVSVTVVEGGSFPDISNGNLSQIPYYPTHTFLHIGMIGSRSSTGG